MNIYPKNLEFTEFLEIFRDRYVFENDDGRPLIAMTTGEGLLLSKYLFRGIMEWTATSNPAGAVIGNVGPSSMGEFLERFAARSAGEANLEVRITEEDLRALGKFLLQGLVGLILTLDQARGGTTCGIRKYSRGC
ncbi:MAG: hypothetical protein MOB07_13025 [Acidobacteria bacterium]|nr:hypothetical protein [Acidobacteriota bacterium]